MIGHEFIYLAGLDTVRSAALRVEETRRTSLLECQFSASPQPCQHVPGDLFDLRVSPRQSMGPIG